MSEYSWPVKGMWCGIEDDTFDYLDRDRLSCIGVCIRSGQVKALGHFCFVKVSVSGKKVYASNAEARIYPFHSVKLSEIGKTPKDMIPALGFATNGNDYCFLYEGKVVTIAGKGLEGLEPVPEDQWQPQWKEKVTSE